MIPTISTIRIYPIKGLSGTSLETAVVGRHSLQFDRQFAMELEDSSLLNGKKDPRVNLISLDFDFTNEAISIQEKESKAEHIFELRVDNHDLDDFLSSFFHQRLRLITDTDGGLMDVPRRGSLSVYSEASLKALHQDLGRHDLDNLRARFRSNIELTGVEPYWEEQLYDRPGHGVAFSIGEVACIGAKPRVRCPVPPQDPESGQIDKHFVRDHIAHRNKPEHGGEKLLRYNNGVYFFAVDAFIPLSEEGKVIQTGDSIEIGEIVDLKPYGL